MKRESLTKEPERPFLSLPAERKSYDEIVDLFARGASSAEVLAFRPSKETQQRVRELLERNAADDLSEEEAAELANGAGAVVVGKVGSVGLTPDELSAMMAHHHDASH